MRIGFGYDVHRLLEGRKLVLGGVQIDYSMGLLGHSDGDVLIHAIIDALLGAIANGDIGTHFPDSDMRYKDISSLVLLEETRHIIANAGYNIRNIDVTVVAQQPKLAKYICEIKQRISNVLKCSTCDISIKAKTTEGLGFVGQQEGIAVYAVACLEEN